MRQSDDDRLLGDIAQILRGRDLPDDITAIIERTLQSDDAETRRQAMRALQDTDTDRGALVEAAIANLAAAETDDARVIASGELFPLNGSPTQVSTALAEALAKMELSNQRMQIAGLLAEGMTKLAEATAMADSQEELSDLVRVLSAHSTADPGVIDALIVSSFHTEDPDTRRSAMSGLVRIGEPAIKPIVAAIADTDDPEVRRDLESTLDLIRN